MVEVVPPRNGSRACANCSNAAKNVCSGCKAAHYCDEVCQRANRTDHKHSCRLLSFGVRDHDGERVVLAHKAIPKDTLVLVEKPLAVVLLPSLATAAAMGNVAGVKMAAASSAPERLATNMADAFCKWTPEEITSSYALAPLDSPNGTPIDDVVKDSGRTRAEATVADRAIAANSFNAGSMLSGQQYAHTMYAKACWFNHSCDPNSKYLIGKYGHIYIYTIRDVISGEEMTIPYRNMDANACKCMRQRHMHEKMGFFCTCKACMTEGCIVGMDDPKLRHSRKHFPVAFPDGGLTLVNAVDYITKSCAIIDAIVDDKERNDAMETNAGFIYMNMIRIVTDSGASGALLTDDDLCVAMLAASTIPAHKTMHVYPAVFTLAASTYKGDSRKDSVVASECTGAVSSIARSLCEAYPWHPNPTEFSPAGIVSPVSGFIDDIEVWVKAFKRLGA